MVLAVAWRGVELAALLLGEQVVKRLAGYAFRFTIEADASRFLASDVRTEYLLELFVLLVLVDYSLLGSAPILTLRSRDLNLRQKLLFAFARCLSCSLLVELHLQGVRGGWASRLIRVASTL